jgi:hypothetical protein
MIGTGDVFTFGRYVPRVPKAKDSDPLERWRHFEAKYAERLVPLLEGAEVPYMDKDEMVELASLRAKADRWRDRFFKALEGVSD